MTSNSATPNALVAVKGDCDTVKGACGIAPETVQSIAPTAGALVVPKSAAHAVLTKVGMLWENGATITYSFFGGTKNQHDAVNAVIPEWMLYANLNLQGLADNNKTAKVRIAFDPNAGSWSSVGKGALQIKDGITMNLGWIDDSATISDNDRGTILHEWGHALGLMHEHQSRARDGTLTLKREEVISYYGATQGWAPSLIQSQILDVYKADDVSNYSKLDTSSVMMYFMPGRLNDQGITVDVNNKLSDMDKAYMVINYPRDKPDLTAPEWTVEYALEKAGVPLEERTEILKARHDASTMRVYFTTWNKEVREKEREASKVPTPASPVPEDATLLPLLTALHCSVQHGLFSDIGSILSHPLVSQALTGLINTALAQNGLNPQTTAAQYPAMQHGIWTSLASVIQNPTFQHIVGSVVNTVVNTAATQQGLNPQTTAVHPIIQNPNVQQDIWSGIANIVKHPMFQQIVGSVVNAALTQHGINPAAPPAPPPVMQNGLFSDIGSILSHPLVSQTLTGLINTAFAQRGLDPQMTAAQYPAMQHGIWTGIAGVIQNPAFQHIVGNVVNTVVNTAFTQRGLNPQTTAAHTVTQEPSVQHGIWSSISDIFKHPVFQHIVTAVVDTVLTQHGIKPTASPLTPPTHVQHGLFSVITQGLSGIFGMLSGVNPNKVVAQPPLTQQDVFKPWVYQSVISPSVNYGQTIGTPPWNAHEVYRPEAQHGLFGAGPAGTPQPAYGATSPIVVPGLDEILRKVASTPVINFAHAALQPSLNADGAAYAKSVGNISRPLTPAGLDFSLSADA
ncbi:hypothetical protein FPV67DRAFT_1668901 [Lyophyllum atratum]|nr:hypothetical protein FPV67DRAFT_1668901 [Lyophyllum atratum]